MHHALPAGTLIPSFHRPYPLLEQVGYWLVGRTTDFEFSGTVSEQIDWDVIYDDDLSLVTNVGQVTAPADTKYCQWIYSGGSGAVSGNFFSAEIYKNGTGGTVIGQTASHGGDYNGLVLSGWCEMVEDDTIEVYATTNDSASDVTANRVFFGGRFYK